MDNNQNADLWRPRRSCLYMPGSNARAMEKAQNLPADVIILDLEDAVAPEGKEAARDAVCAKVTERPYGNRETVIRINALQTPWGRQDLQQVAASPCDALLVPKVTSAADIAVLDEAMAKAGAASEMALWVMIEMPLALVNIAEIAAIAARTRLRAFVLGTNDLAKEMRAPLLPGRAAFQSAMQMCLLAARAHGVAAIDGVFNDISDTEGLEEECLQGRQLGFDGKSLIHPSQLEICNRVFAPSSVEIAQAKAIIAAFGDPANAGKGAIKLDGKMVELLHLEEAKRIAAMADAIGAL